jgi:hypothetical protein
LDSTVVILNIPAHDTQKNKKSNWRSRYIIDILKIWYCM